MGLQARHCEPTGGAKPRPDDRPREAIHAWTALTCIKAIKLLRAALWAAPSSGVTHPSWRAYAIDNADAEVTTRGEALLGSYAPAGSQDHCPSSHRVRIPKCRRRFIRRISCYTYPSVALH